MDSAVQQSSIFEVVKYFMDFKGRPLSARKLLEKANDEGIKTTDVEFALTSLLKKLDKNEREILFTKYVELL